MSNRVLLGALALCCAHSAMAEDAYLRLRCEGDAAGAQVTINGAPKGECPIDLAIPEGTISLMVRKDLDAYRFRLYEKELFLPAGSMKRETIVLGAVQLTPAGERLKRLATQSGGIGMGLRMVPTGMHVEQVLPDTPAALAGVQVADVITHIDGQSVAGLLLVEGVARTRGQPGTLVRLTLVRPGVPNPVTLDLVRAALFQAAPSGASSSP